MSEKRISTREFSKERNRKANLSVMGRPSLREDYPSPPRECALPRTRLYGEPYSNWLESD
jgi:hypothetical protein